VVLGETQPTACASCERVLGIRCAQPPVLSLWNPKLPEDGWAMAASSTDRGEVRGAASVGERARHHGAETGKKAYAPWDFIPRSRGQRPCQNLWRDPVSAMVDFDGATMATVRKMKTPTVGSHTSVKEPLTRFNWHAGPPTSDPETHAHTE
jgi:hypothetical protein